MDDIKTAGRLVPGLLTREALYDLTRLEHVGWTGGDDSGREGYAVEYYFYANRYLGPDAHGIEPIFAPDSIHQIADVSRG